jgi:DNA-binding LytR/AlgR family response regulator
VRELEHILNPWHRPEKQLQEFRPQLFRCHRAYIVNLGQIHKVAGNARDSV